MEPGPAFGSRILQGPPSREDSDVAFFDQGLGTGEKTSWHRFFARLAGAHVTDYARATQINALSRRSD